MVASAVVVAVDSSAVVVAGAVRATTDHRGWRRWLRRTPVLTVLVVLVLAGAGAGAWAVVASSGPGYQLATARLGDVQQTLDLTGTIQPVDEATLEFQVSGKVASVDVTAGQTVTSGEVLASLDSSSLQAAVTQDQSTLSTDQDKLTSDEASESSDPSSSASSSASSTDSSSNGSTGSTSTGSSPSSSSPSGSSSTSSGSSNSGDLTSQISTAQQQLVADQHTVDTMETQESSDLQNANSVCQAPGGSGSPQCSAALSQVLSDQQQEASDLAAVSQDETSLSKLLSEEQAALQGSGGASSHGSGSSGSGTSGTESTATPATIASDQAAIDAVQAQLDEDEQALNEAQLTTPLAGVVAEINMTVGQGVSAGSTSTDIVVQGPDSFEVIGDVALTDLGDVHVGDTANVVPDGASDAVPGTVSAVSNMPATSSSSSSGDYQLTVSLPANTPGLYNGSNAEVSIVTGEAHDVLTVPTSAVHALGREYYVEVLDKATSKLTVVGIGAMDGELTQITSGLTAGRSVILANLAEPLPSASTSGPGGIVSLEGGGGGFTFSGRFPAGGEFQISRSAG